MLRKITNPAMENVFFATENDGATTHFTKHLITFDYAQLLDIAIFIKKKLSRELNNRLKLTSI